MKNLKPGLCSLSAIFLFALLNAQEPVIPVREPDYSKPLLFHQLPQKIECRTHELLSLLQATKGQEIDLDLALNFKFRGTVTSVANKYNGALQSVVIRSVNYDGAVLSFSKTTDEYGVIKYSGRILSFNHGDALEITEEEGRYFFIKKSLYDIINE